MIIPILQIKILRCGKFKQFARIDMANNWWRQQTGLGVPSSVPPPLGYAQSFNKPLSACLCWELL